jgi:hypothetical protein
MQIMTVAQNKAARRRFKMKYGKGRSYRTVAESIVAERRKAARALRIRAKG